MMRWRLLLAVSFCVAFWPVSGAAQQAAPFGKYLSGKPVKELGAAVGATKAAVLFFVATDCPISDRSFPEMKKLSRVFTPQGVKFWFVYANATETSDGVRRHQRAFDAEDEAILDPADALVRLAGAKVTPEAAVLMPDGKGEWRTVYRGRIDDRFVRIGLERPAATQMLMEEALKAVLMGKPVVQDMGTPVGCGIVMRRVGQR